MKAYCATKLLLLFKPCSCSFLLMWELSAATCLFLPDIIYLTLLFTPLFTETGTLAKTQTDVIRSLCSVCIT